MKPAAAAAAPADRPHPEVAPLSELATRTDEIIVDVPRDVLDRRLATAKLEDQLPKTSALPGVVGTTDLTPGPFGQPGARRMVHLSDGGSATEQVLERDAEGFRYVVWNYTTPAARPVAYAVGQFRYLDLGDGRTRIVWTYSFKLNPQRFPGVLGPLGRWLFRLAFLDRAYAELMRETLKAMKAYAERAG